MPGSAPGVWGQSPQYLASAARRPDFGREENYGWDLSGAAERPYIEVALSGAAESFGP